MSKENQVVGGVGGRGGGENNGVVVVVVIVSRSQVSDCHEIHSWNVGVCERACVYIIHIHGIWLGERGGQLSLWQALILWWWYLSLFSFTHNTFFLFTTAFSSPVLIVVMSFRNRPPSSMPQRRSMKGKIGGYLKRTTMASLATLAEQFGNMRPYLRASARSSTSREATFPIPKESSTTNDISSLSCTTITPIDEGFHQTQQKVVSMDSWILNDTTKTSKT